MASELVGKAAPDFEIELEDGSKKKLSAFLAEGKPVVIDFYANFWPACGPAASEMDKLANDHENITFILVNLKGVADGKAYKSDKGLSSPKLIHAAGRPPNEYGLKYIPHKTIIGKDGVVIKNFEGVNLAADVKSL